MTEFTAQDPGYEARVQDSFARQTFMATIGATLHGVAPGSCEIRLPYRADLCQQHGFLHAGVTCTIADTAAGYAAFSLMPAGSSVLTTEFKLNLLNPAAGSAFVARARVIKPGRTLSVVQSEVFALGRDGAETQIAVMLASMICLRDRLDR